MLICIDAGHYMGTPGKRCLKSIDPNETREWYLNGRVADKVQELLKDYNCETMRVDDTTGKQDVTLAQRVKKANQAKADFYLSIHHNAGINGGSGGGIVVYVCKGVGADTTTPQKAIYNHTVAATGLKGNRANPLGVAEYYVLVNTDMPAVLGEFGFMDSTTDTPIILTEDYANKLAQGIVNGLVESLGLTKKSTASNSTSTNQGKYWYNGKYVVPCKASKLKIAMTDKAKSRNGVNTANAGFFSNYKEGFDFFTLPVAHLTCDYEATSQYVKKYCTERGKFNGDKFSFDSSAWSYNNPQYNKALTNLVVKNGKATISESTKLPDGDYVISGIPVIRNGKAVSYDTAKAQGWGTDTLRATWHTLIGVKDENTVYIIGLETTNSNLLSSQEAYNILKELECTDVIKLDGGGSFYLNVNGEVEATSEDRRINNIIYFTPMEPLKQETEDDAMADEQYTQWKKYMQQYRDELGASESLLPEQVAAAKELGLTDGSRPRDFASREEVMTMVKNAVNIVKGN